MINYYWELTVTNYNSNLKKLKVFALPIYYFTMPGAIMNTNAEQKVKALAQKYVK